MTGQTLFCCTTHKPQTVGGFVISPLNWKCLLYSNSKKFGHLINNLKEFISFFVMCFWSSIWRYFNSFEHWHVGIFLVSPDEIPGNHFDHSSMPQMSKYFQQSGNNTCFKNGGSSKLSHYHFISILYLTGSPLVKKKKNQSKESIILQAD